MDIKQANKIIDSYEASIAKGTVGETVLRKTSWLSYPKAMIKYAHLSLLEDAVECSYLTSDLRKRLVESYAMLESFVPDVTADKYAQNYADWQQKKSDLSKNKKDEGLAKQYINYSYMLKLRNSELRDEISEFMEALIKQR